MPSWGIVQQNNRILFVQRSASTSRAGQWCFPGGGIKSGETPEDACVREVFEETSLHVSIEKLHYQIDESYYYLCSLLEEGLEITLKENECADFAWVEPEKLLELGVIMDLKKMIPILQALGYTIDLNDIES